jgi:hypothetical protein
LAVVAEPRDGVPTKSGKPAAERSRAGGRATGADGILRLELVGESVLAAYPACPDLVDVGAKTRILSALKTTLPALEVAVGDLLRLVNCARDRDRLVVALFVLDDQYREPQVGIGL